MDAWPQLHQRIGNSQHLPQAVPGQHRSLQRARLGFCFGAGRFYSFHVSQFFRPIFAKGIVLLATLSCVELYTTTAMPSKLYGPNVVLPVQANGLCFWACLFLSTKATHLQLLGWHSRPRNSQGFPSPEECTMEDDVVTRFALAINGGDLPVRCRGRICFRDSAVHEDMAPCLQASICN